MNYASTHKLYSSGAAAAAAAAAVRLPDFPSSLVLDVRWIPEVPDSGPVLSVESAFGLVPPTGPWGEEKTMWSERCPLQSPCVVHHEVESLAGNDVVVENSLQLKLLELRRRCCHRPGAGALFSVPGGLSRSGTAIGLGREHYPRTTLCLPQGALRSHALKGLVSGELLFPPTVAEGDLSRGWISSNGDSSPSSDRAMCCGAIESPLAFVPQPCRLPSLADSAV